MVLKTQVREYLTEVLEELASIENEGIRALASLGVAQVLEEVINELRYSKNMYKETEYGY